MAAENNDINYNVDIDLRDSIRSIDELQTKLKNFGQYLEVDADRVRKEMKRAANDYVAYIKRLEKELKTLRSKGQDTTAHEARLNQMRGRQRSASLNAARDYSGGTDNARAMRAVFDRQLNEMKSESKQLIGRYYEQLNQMNLSALRRSMTDLGTEEKILRSRMEERYKRANMGDAAYGFSKQRERRTLNGGANQFASQFGILSNYAMVGGLYGGGYYLGNFIAQLDKEFKQFQAITNTTNEAMGSFEKRLEDVAAKSKFTAQEVAQAATTMGQAGLSAAEVGKAIGPVTELAAAAGTDLNEAVDVVTSSLTIFNQQTDQAAQIADTYTAALNKSKLTLNQLTLALQYSGNIANKVGINYHELTAAIGALANAGIRRGSTIGTGLRQLMVGLITPSKQLKETLDKLGLTMADIDLKSNGLTGVLTNLENAGFNTSDAFNDFRVRAAAAFAALSNNLSTITDLRQEFLLSDAATKASETQMESLVNTAKKLGSNIGVLAYDAFKPLVGELQTAANGVADVTSALDKARPVVEVVGTAFGTLVGTYIIMRLGKLAAGLLKISSAALEAEGAIAALNIIVRENPIFFGLAALTTSIALLRQFGDVTSSVADQLDHMKTVQDANQAQIDSTNSKIEHLNETLDDLIAKQAMLDKQANSGLRETKIMEVVSSFEELGTKVNASTSSVKDLIGAIRDLKGELVKGLPDQFKQLVHDIDQRLEILRKAREGYTSHQGLQKGVAAVSRRFGYKAGEMSTPGKFNLEVGRHYGGDVLKAYEALTQQSDFKNMTGLNAQGTEARIQSQIIDLQKALKTEMDPTKRRTDQHDLQFLQAIKEAFHPIVESLLKTQAAQKEREIQQVKYADTSLQNTSAYRQAGDLKVQTQQFVQNRLTDIIRNVHGITAQHGALKDLQTQVADRVKMIREKLKEAGDQLRQKGDFTDSEIQKALGTDALNQEVAKLQHAADAKSKEANDAFKKYLKYVDQEQEKAIKAKMENVKKELSGAQSEREVNILENRLYSLDNQLKKTEQEVFNDSPDKSIGKDAADVELAKRKLKDQQAARRKGLVETVIKKRQDLADQANKAYEDDLKTQLSNVQRQMKNLADSIDNHSTIDYIKQVKAKLDQLNQKAQQLAGEVASVDVSGNQTAFTAGGLPSASTSDVQKQIIQYANKKGIPPQIALAISSFETGGTFNPHAKNPGSSAYGLFQSTNKNWASHGYTSADRNNVADQIHAGIDDMLRTQKALGTTQLSFRDYYGAHLLGQGGYLKARNHPNENAASLLGADAVLGNGGNLRESAKEFVDAITQRAAVHLQKVKDLIQKPTEAADNALTNQTTKLTQYSRDAMQAAGKNIEKNAVHHTVTIMNEAAKKLKGQVNTLMVESSKMSDPAGIQSIIDQVRTTWGEMMKKEVSAFTAKHKGEGDFQSQLADLKDRLNSGLQQHVVTLLDRYQSSIEHEQYKPLQNAQAQLAAAQNPLYAYKYSQADVQSMQHNVQVQQQAAQMQKLNELEQLHTYILQQVSEAEAQYGKNSQQVQVLQARQYEVEKSLNQVRVQAKADTDAASRSEMGYKQAIDAANMSWMQRHGLMDSSGRMISVAQQVGNAWGQMLDGVGSSVSQLFMDMASGSESAGEAFKKMGLSIVQMLMQMIAKAMVFNMIQNMMGKGTSSSGLGFLGLLFKGFGASGAATGDMIPGVRRAAIGEMVTGNQPFRDSELRKVMPGEAILRASAVSQIGRTALDKVNNLGNRRVSSSLPHVMAQQNKPGQPVNVWAVLPEEKPQPGPNDVVAYVTDNIRRRGKTHELIKAVQAGKM